MPNYPKQWPAYPHSAFRSIKSLELIACSSRTDSTSTRALDIVRMVPSTFPSLQRLYLAFGRGGLYDTWAHGPKQTYLQFSEEMPPIIDEFAPGYAPGSLNLEVGVPTSVFYASYWVAIMSGKRFQIPGWKPGVRGEPGERERVWRTVNATVDGGEDGQFGYWLSETDSDMPDAWMVTMPRYWE